MFLNRITEDSYMYQSSTVLPSSTKLDTNKDSLVMLHLKLTVYDVTLHVFYQLVDRWEVIVEQRREVLQHLTRSVVNYRIHWSLGRWSTKSAT